MEMSQRNIVKRTASTNPVDSPTPSSSPGSFSPFVSENWCVSKRDVTRVDFEWNIQHLAFLRASEKWISATCRSPSFLAKETQDDETSRPKGVYKWGLSLSDAEDKLEIRLHLIWENNTFRFSLPDRQCHSPAAGARSGDSDVVANKTNRPVRIKIGIVNSKRERVFLNERVLPIDSDVPHLIYGVDKKWLAESDRGLDLHADGSLTVYCEIETFLETGVLSSKAISAQQHQLFRHSDILIRTQFEGLFKDMKLCDFIFNIGGRAFEAHKIILAVRSPVFASVLENGSLCHLDVPDIDPEVFQEVLRFIYTGRVPCTAMEKMAASLWAAADKYLLEQLREECETHLTYRMSPDNCLELLSLTDQHSSAPIMKKLAVDFFRRFPDEVMASDRWKKAKELNSVWLCGIQEMVFRSPVQLF